MMWTIVLLDGLEVCGVRVETEWKEVERLVKVWDGEMGLSIEVVKVR